MAEFDLNDLDHDALTALRDEINGHKPDTEQDDESDDDVESEPAPQRDHSVWATIPDQPKARVSARLPQDFQPKRANDTQKQAFALETARREGPKQGWWRRLLHSWRIPVGKSKAELDYDKDVERINKLIRHPKVIGVVSFKGGVGNSSAVICIASTIASLRRKGEVIAVDADEKGTLARRMRGEQPSHVQALAADPELNSVNDVNAHLLTNADRLSVLGSNRSPDSKPLQPEEYLRALEVLKANALIVMVDMDKSAASPAYDTIMRNLDALVVVTTPTLDSADAAKAMFGWLRAKNLTKLLTSTIVLMNYSAPGKPFLNVDGAVSHFRNAEKRDTVLVPFDEHLYEGRWISLDLLNKRTRRVYVEIAALIIDKLPSV